MFEYSSIPQIADLRKCRLCFDNQTSLIHIFETSGSLNDVARTISEVLNFEVSAEDHFPPFVCSLCSGKLFEFKAFKVYGQISVAENLESRVFMERNIAEPNPEELSPYNVVPLPIKVEHAVDGGGIGASEQIESEQVSKDSPYNVAPLPIKVEHAVDDDGTGISEQAESEQDTAFNVAEFPIKTELVEEEDEVEISEQAEIEQVPKITATRHWER
ncbi:hypothetical protein J437_LFUL017326 [Ladona fulva]|uniref:ZAD domain-containing protein n=1 Tax=Ladona fulva TaxID=123851 RepID=A0A8K0P9Y0_LADFU|nr:hypothetical protein J437_LFUL017326 [Ladona fulva]